MAKVGDRVLRQCWALDRSFHRSLHTHFRDINGFLVRDVRIRMVTNRP